MRRTTVIVALCTAWALPPAASSAQQGAPSEGRAQPGPRLKIERDIAFGDAHARPLTLDLYRPDPVSAPTALIVWVHGSTGGDTSKVTTPVAALATSGYAVASIDHRGAADRVEQGVADARAAVQWLRANAARFNIDPEKIGIIGHDLGGTIALMVGTQGEGATAAGGAVTPGSGSAVRAVVALGAPSGRGQAAHALADITKGDPPTLLFHGTADAVVSTLESQAVVSAMKVAGVDATLELLVGATHDLNTLATPLVMQQIGAFFDQTLRGARRQGGTSSYLATPLTEYVDPIAIDFGGTLYKTFPTPVRGPGTVASYRIYLPPDYATSGTRRYPVIYFMHGSLVDSKRPVVAGYVARVDAAIRSGVMPPTIVVLPQGLNQNRWIDSRDGSKPMESIIIRNLIPHIDATYRTIARRDGRAIEGHSMGGFGSLHTGFNNPDLFAAVTGNAPGGVTFDTSPPEPNSGRIDAFAIVYGSDRSYFEAMQPTTLAAKNLAKVKQQAVRIICGTEDGLFPGARFVHEELTKLGVEHEWIPVPGSPHNHDQLLQYQTFDTMAFYGKVFANVK